jgi:hypothetical protein
MSSIANFRISTRDQTMDAQRATLGGPFDREFVDDGVSGVTAAKSTFPPAHLERTAGLSGKAPIRDVLGDQVACLYRLKGGS